MRYVTMLKKRSSDALQSDVRIWKYRKDQDQRNIELRLQLSRGSLAKQVGKANVTDSERFAFLL